MKSFLFLFVFICLCSCTITKRIHNPGWHVEWKSNHSSVKNLEPVAEDQSLIAADSPTESVVVQQATVENGTHVHPYQAGEYSSSHKHESQLLDQELVEINAEKENAIGSMELANEELTVRKISDEKPIHYLSKASLILLILSLVFLIFGSAILISMNFALGPWVIVIIGFICLIVSLVMAIKALKQINKNPEKWSGRNMALAVVIISSILILPTLLYLLLLRFFQFFQISGGWWF